MEREEGGGVMVGRAEIDTRAPFKSVKEAVMLFGERVLAGEIYAHKLKEMQAAASRNEHGFSRLGSVTAELEETKLNLEKTREESLEMAKCLSSLQEELERTKNELKQLKARGSEKRTVELEIEDLKFVENATKTNTPMSNEMAEFQKKRCVTFANPPSLAQVMNTETQVLERQLSVDKEAAPLKKKKKPLIPLIGGIFSKKKGYQEGHALPNARGS